MTDQTIAGDDAGLVAEDDSPATEVETTEAEFEAPEDGTEAEEGDGDETEGDEEELEEIEFSFRGEKLRVPKGSIPEELATKVDQFVRDAEASTTRKSQEIAETRKALDARETAVEKLIGLQGEALNTYSRGLALRSEIEQLRSIDLPALWQSNPDQARRVSDQLSRKQDEFQRVVNDVSTKEDELNQANADERDRRTSEGKQVLERRIKDFEKTKPEFFEYVEQTSGLPREVIERDYAVNPEITVAFHKAMLFDRMQAKAKATTAKPKPSAPAAPVTPMRGKGGKGQKNPDDMNIEEWTRWRENQLRKKA